MKKKLGLIFTVAMLCASAFAQNAPEVDGASAAPDAWLLVKRGPSWWYQTQPSPTPVTLQQRTPTKDEQVLIDRARALVERQPAKAFALMVGDTVLMTAYKAPANDDSVLFGFSMGKTVTSMAVGQAICAGKLQLDSKASDLVHELKGKALGNATVRDLLRMASGAAEPNPDSSIWTPEQFKEWGRGNLNLVDLIASDRVTTLRRIPYGRPAGAVSVSAGIKTPTAWWSSSPTLKAGCRTCMNLRGTGTGLCNSLAESC
jgi:CubicO group peptidase (beta-lactamase class C family)